MMGKEGKAFIITLIFLVIVGFLLAGGSFYFYQKEKEKSATLQETLDDLRTKFKLTETKLEETKKQLAFTEAKLEESKNQLEMLNNELDKERKAKEEILSNLNELKSIIEEKEAKQKALEEDLDRVQKEANRLRAKLKNVEQEKEDLEKKLKEMELAQKKNVELGEIVVEKQPIVETAKEKVITKKESQKEGVSEAKSPLEGKVLVVNKDYNFVVINLGIQQGIRLNDVFSVYHKEKYIGDIKVEKLHDSMAAAGFISEHIKDEIAEGDKVVLKTQ
jgi:outer membrane murein-binding lipoprotein Lpp